MCRLAYTSSTLHYSSHVFISWRSKISDAKLRHRMTSTSTCSTFCKNRISSSQSSMKFMLWSVYWWHWFSSHAWWDALGHTLMPFPSDLNPRLQSFLTVHYQFVLGRNWSSPKSRCIPAVLAVECAGDLYSVLCSTVAHDQANNLPYRDCNPGMRSQSPVRKGGGRRARADMRSCERCSKATSEFRTFACVYA